MGSDFWLVVRWWGTLFLVGAAAWPLTRCLFGGKKNWFYFSDRTDKNNSFSSGWWDEGYLFAKAVGMAVVTYLIYVLGTTHVLAFSIPSIVVSLIVVFMGGVALSLTQGHRFPEFKEPQFRESHRRLIKSFLIIFVEELFFFALLLLWSWVKGHEASIRGLEKFMDYGFMKSILISPYFPPADIWYAGFPINYYYFGHMVVAVLTRLSGIDLAYTFNLMLASIFAFTATMSFSIGVQLSVVSNQQSARLKAGGGKLKALFAGLLTSFLVTLAGNMQTIYAFTKGYTGDNVQPFWTLLWSFNELTQNYPVKLMEGLNRYWYANATRFIPFTIHEFPSYSFVVSDVHGHVLSLPFVLLAIALLIQMFGFAKAFSEGVRDPLTKRVGRTNTTFWQGSLTLFSIMFYGFLVAILLMTNALDGPIYFGLFVLLYIILRANPSLRGEVEKSGAIVLDFARTIGVVLLTAALASLPFMLHFKSFVTGLAINCPPAWIANRKIGPFLFEAVEKCQHSPVWMMWLLWGFFIYCGGWLISQKIQKSKFKFQIGKLKLSIPIKLGNNITQTEKLLLVFFIFSIGLIIFPEFFYFKDIYPAHFRSNTMFKLGYDAFILFSIVSGYTIVQFLTSKVRWAKAIFIVLLIPQLFLISIYPVFSVRSYFDSLRIYKGLYGFSWFAAQYPDDYAGINWLNQQIGFGQQGSPSERLGAIKAGSAALIEADGDSYTDYERFSAFTGMPTIVGWAVHEWLWRGSYDAVSPRREEVRQVYESTDMVITREILAKYHVQYIIVGSLEREKFKNLAELKFVRLGKEVFRQGKTVIYQVDSFLGQ